MRLSKEKKELLREMVYHGKRLYNDDRWWWIADEFDREKDKLYVTIKTARHLLENSLVEYVRYAKNYKATMYGILAVADVKLIARAERILKKRGDAYEPKGQLYYLVFAVEDGDECGEVEPEDGGEFCESCIDSARALQFLFRSI